MDVVKILCFLIFVITYMHANSVASIHIVGAKGKEGQVIDLAL